MSDLDRRLNRLEVADAQAPDPDAPPDCIIYLPDNGRDPGMLGRHPIPGTNNVLCVYDADDPDDPNRPPPAEPRPLPAEVADYFAGQNKGGH